MILMMKKMTVGKKKDGDHDDVIMLKWCWWPHADGDDNEGVMMMIMKTILHIFIPTSNPSQGPVINVNVSRVLKGMYTLG